MMAGLNCDLPVSQHTPKEIKKSVTGNGNASKDQVESMARSILSGGKEGLSHDAFDAGASAHAEIDRMHTAGQSQSPPEIKVSAPCKADQSTSIRPPPPHLPAEPPGLTRHANRQSS